MTPILIYRHIAPDGRSYIGQTNTSLRARWLRHVRAAKNLVFANGCAFHTAIVKYGPDVWTHEELEWVRDKWTANKRERFWIKHYKTEGRGHGFNTQSGG